MAEKKEMYCRSILGFLFILVSWAAQAQQATPFNQQYQKEHNPYYKAYYLYNSSGQGQRQLMQPLKPQGAFSAVAFSLPDKAAFAGLYCLVEGDSLPVKPALHQPEDRAGIVSELLIFDSPKSEIYLSGQIPEEGIWVHFIYAGDVEQHKKGHPGTGGRKMSSPCEEPQAIPQSVWRAGLPEPDYSRSFNEVGHLIVHHSATGNHLSNYTNVVRNIYLYHTEVNGWSDIGYNYLIAQDGSLFAGRDPGNGEQDNVRGAHFCGQNGGTMGVCLLGDYTKVEPAAAALQSLEHLLSWKSKKEEIEPLAAHAHPANSSLPVIAGHQDGCATACPGPYVYDQLPELRLAVQQRLLACEEGIETPQPWVYFAPHFREVCLGGVPEEELSALQVYDVQGRHVGGRLIRLESKDICFKVPELAPGVYFLQAERGAELIRKRFMIF